MKVAVPAAWVSGGHLPPLCPTHGLPQTHVRGHKFYSRTSVPLFLLIGALSTLFRDSVSGVIPGCERCADIRSRHRRRVLLGWGATLALFIAGFALTNAALFLLGLLAATVALVATFLRPWETRAQVVSGGQAVELRNVSDEFVAVVAPHLNVPIQSVSPMAIPVGSPSPAGVPDSPVFPNTAVAPSAVATQTILPS